MATYARWRTCNTQADRKAILGDVSIYTFQNSGDWWVMASMGNETNLYVMAKTKYHAYNLAFSKIAGLVKAFKTYSIPRKI